ncbi:MAG: GNAT family N-acetyltransferase [Anaerosomatales bacterium]
MSRGAEPVFVVREIEPGTPEYEQAADVRYDALYREWGLPRTLIEDTDGRVYRHVGAFDGERLVGYARLWLEDGQSKIFQLAVAGDRQGEGIGALLIDSLLEWARDAGRTQVELDARIHVVGYYERLGFVAVSDVFIAGRAHTPHRRMRRSLDIP